MVTARPVTFVMMTKVTGRAVTIFAASGGWAPEKNQVLPGRFAILEPTEKAFFSAHTESVAVAAAKELEECYGTFYQPA